MTALTCPPVPATSHVQREPENYEALLSNIASDIADRRARLADIRQRQRRATFWLTVYAGSTWVVYVALWYVRLLPNAHPVLVGPILILFARRIMEAWYTRIGNAEEATLKKLIDIKKKTNYYSTRNLLERYDETGTPKKPNVPPPGPGAPSPGQIKVLIPPQRPGQALPQTAYSLSPVQQPVTPPKRQWYDRFVDVVLGEDTEGGSGKYALICSRCFAHNGLVKEEIWNKTKYTCPKCGFFNDAPAAKGSHSASASDGLSSSVSSPTLGPVSGPTLAQGSRRVLTSLAATMPALRNSIGPSHRRSPLSSTVDDGYDVDEEEEEEEEKAVEDEVDSS
ncbi:hypothetical protein BKA62DRAFT_718528 [Auriculariales sp. MPI-PUGE-AT-0066]|nr:hypothetical protein BKA62DRAFT_718528 [Auriculariales sp. MPI-PUGE-AT-0066]